MELHQLRSFVAVAEEGHLTHAARRLFLSQPAVSAHLKHLESELGVTLFNRTRNGMQLTESGRLLLDEARGVLEALKHFQNQARNLRGEAVGTARIGINTDPVFLRVSELLAGMSRYPKVEFRFVQGLSGNMIEDIRQGRLDAGFLFLDNPYPEIESIPLATTHLCIVAPASWKEKLATEDLEALMRHTWILTPPQCPYRQRTDAMLQKQGLEPSRIITADMESTLQVLVARQRGMSVMRQDSARAAEAAGEIAVWEGRTMGLTLSFAFCKDRAGDPVIRALTQALENIWDLDPARAGGP
jgi:DNA-binding transcriptional LysR family regulator